MYENKVRSVEWVYRSYGLVNRYQIEREIKKENKNWREKDEERKRHVNLTFIFYFINPQLYCFPNKIKIVLFSSPSSSEFDLNWK